jgi:hypothetical protein
MTVNVTGLAGTGSVGAVTVIAKANVVPTGVAAIGEVGTPLVWGTIVPNQNPSYTPEQPTQSPVWGAIVPNQNPSYTPEQPTQSPGWSSENPSQSPGWTRKAA